MNPAAQEQQQEMHATKQLINAARINPAAQAQQQACMLKHACNKVATKHCC
jgi:hypothetical protein